MSVCCGKRESRMPAAADHRQPRAALATHLLAGRRVIGVPLLTGPGLVVAIRGRRLLSLRAVGIAVFTAVAS